MVVLVLLLLLSLARTMALIGSELVTVKWVTADGIRVIEGVRRGELLRSALLKRGLSPHNGKAQSINCRGLGTCGTCALDIQGAVVPNDRSAVERARLNFPPHSSSEATFRLACQCRVDGDLTVSKKTGFWGQGKEMAAAQQGIPVFGDLEFLFDSKASEITCGVCEGSTLVPCPDCQGRSCKACQGSGQVVCRSCFSLDPYDLEAVRQRAKNRPD